MGGCQVGDNVTAVPGTEFTCQNVIWPLDLRLFVKTLSALLPAWVRVTQVTLPCPLQQQGVWWQWHGPGGVGTASSHGRGNNLLSPLGAWDSPTGAKVLS